MFTATNLAFCEWTSVFGNDIMTMAPLDLLRRHCEIFGTGNQCWRFKVRDSLRGSVRGYSSRSMPSVRNEVHKGEFNFGRRFGIALQRPLTANIHVAHEPRGTRSTA
ncbi:ATP-binding protein [Methylocystis sp. WRRC1]|uniref:ATP-binding protein n=1 Tax=Methylocystis sp. WRRC1 TaxID=1732014 RepID=UPI001D150A5E|nr:ATP-binding protein [Methylocystis sp. WRRC1]